MMAGTAAVAAAWMVSGLLSGNAEFRANMPMTARMALPRPEMRLAAPSDMFGGALAAASPSYAPEANGAPKLASSAAPVAVTESVPQPQSRPRPRVIASVPLPQARPMQFAEVEAKLQAERRPDVARVASVPAAPSPRIVAQVPRPAQLKDPAHTLAFADAVPPSGVLEPAPRAHVAQAPHAAHSGEVVYSLASADVVSPATTGSIGHAANPVAPIAPAMPAPAPKPAAPVLAYANPDVPMRDNHTAIYDIVAHTVYLPDGERLEAHSGLGRMLDDPHFASAKARGPTPPNVYDLTLRDGLFHGVQALRLNPVTGSKMYGRDGILAHTYMLGPSGQSFGCVSFKHYDEFLHAFRRGEVNRIVVVTHLQEPPAGVRADADDGERYASNSVKDY
jgi:hypothetical protein